MIYRSLIAGALLAVTLAACSRPTSLQPTWHAAKGSVGPYAQVLVVGVTSNQNRRRQFEDLLAARLRENGNTAWASSREMAIDEALNRDTVAGAVRKTGASTVVVTRLVNQEVSVDEVGARTGVKTQRKTETAVDFFRYDYNEYEEPGYLVVKTTVTLTTDVYDAADGRLLYSLDSVTFDKETDNEILSELTTAIARQLRRDGLVK